MTQVNKILKNLESKKLIKAIKSVAVSNTRHISFDTRKIASGACDEVLVNGWLFFSSEDS